MANGKEGRKWLAYGCIGCLGVIVVIVLIVAGIFLTARQSVKSEVVEESVITPEIPRSPAIEAPAEGNGELTAGVGGKVVLDLAGGKFHIDSAGPGEPMRIEASYDTRSYELLERLETGDDGWTYEVEFYRTGSPVMGFVKQLIGGVMPSVTVYLPRDVPIDLKLKIESGGAEMELGGLWLTDLDVEFGQGGFDLQFDEPLKEPIDRMRIRGSMGGFNASGLGNASPRELDVDFSMGGMSLDLRGDWVRDADISISFGMGGGVVRLPGDVRIVGLEGDRFDAPRDSELPMPTLTFSVSGDLDSLEFKN